jgi:acyl carrier protein
MGLDGVELIGKVEDEFHVFFTDDEAIKILTVADFRDAIFRKVGTQAYTQDYIYQRIRAILVDEFAVPLENIRPEARLVADLGLD